MARHRFVLPYLTLVVAAGCYVSHTPADRPEDAARPDGGPVCRGDFEPCAASSDCCGGVCSRARGICAVDEGCGDDACCADGAPCVSDAECCSFLCSAGVCTSECRPELDPCTRHRECCNGECSPVGLCMRGPGCGVEGAACATDIDCCSTECNGGACAPVTCDDYLDGAVVDSCSASFGTCSRAVSGVPCCTRTAYCDAGRVVDQVDCDDDCAQSCVYIADASDCDAFGCMWIVPEGCFGEIDPAWVNGCVRSVGETCAGDADCAVGATCRPFAINPCEGLPCDACFGEERRCVDD